MISEKTIGVYKNSSISLFKLENKQGMIVEISNYGGIIFKIVVPDRNGKMNDVVLGFDNLSQYINQTNYFGVIIGRYANRIAAGNFTLNGEHYQLVTNNENNALHGGLHGFDKKVWASEPYKTNKSVGLTLKLSSPDGDEGYPGNLDVIVKYDLNNKNELRINYSAITDRPTIINLTNHSYFNLNGGKSETILDHILTINASAFTPFNENSIPTGEIHSVDDTPLDFRLPKRINDNFTKLLIEQPKLDNGFDHNFVLNKVEEELSFACKIYDPKSGRILEVFTTEPGMQFYTANHLDGNLKGKNGKNYIRYSGFCIETQHYPDSPNQPNFPTTVLNPNEKFESSTIFRFSAQN